MPDNIGSSCKIGASSQLTASAQQNTLGVQNLHKFTNGFTGDYKAMLYTPQVHQPVSVPTAVPGIVQYEIGNIRFVFPSKKAKPT